MKVCYKILLLGSFPSEWIEAFRKDGIDAINVLKDCKFLLRILRRIYFKLKLPGYSIWFEKWKYLISKYNRVILFDSVGYYSLAVLAWLNKKYPDKRIIFWYWNSVSKSIDPNLIRDNLCEKWSFDIEDCKKYKMNYNTTFYWKCYLSDNEMIKAIDVFFVGFNKGRLEKLISIEKLFKQIGLRTYFHISKYNRHHSFYKPLLYSEVVKHINMSKAVLEIMSEYQTGLTLRAMESIFLKVKLITDNVSIINYDFYNSKNIFVLGKDDISNIINFLTSPYVDIENEILEKYLVSNWLNGFTKNP
jgi:hypothetical protein